jgi:hypothetical protein
VINEPDVGPRMSNLADHVQERRFLIGNGLLQKNS